MKLHNIKDLLKGLLSAALVLCLLISSTAVSAVTTDANSADAAKNEAVKGSDPLYDNGYNLLIENDKLQLYAADTGEHTGTFAVKNMEDGSLWYSNPLDGMDDYVALNLMRLNSVLVIEYYDPATDALVEANSRADSVDMGGLSIEKTQNSVCFTFDFKNLGIVIPLDITLGDDGSLKARVNIEKVKESGEYKLFTVTLLPFLLSAGEKEDGFIFVPDGSGAVMNFNNAKLTYAAYSQPVYGGDYGEISEQQKNLNERITMPVFGIAKKNGGIFSVITEGAAASRISAVVSGVDSTNNAVWNQFDIRKVTTYSLDQGWQGTKTFNVYQESAPKIKALENTYYFLSGGNAGLGGMAECYRAHLIKNGLSEQGAKEPGVYIDYLGAVMRKKSVLGFPTSVKNVTTDFSEAQKITEALKNSGAENLVIRYLNWDTRSITGKIVNKAKPDSKLGGKTDFKKLSEYLAEQNIEFYPDVKLTEYSKNSYLFQQFFAATRNLNKEVNKYYPYKLNLYTKDKTRDAYYLLSLTKINSTAQKFLKSYSKLDVSGLSLSGIASYVTADYNSKSKYFDTCDGEQIYLDVIKKASENQNLLLSDANMSAAVYADHIVNVRGSSGYDMLDYGVPFYGMTLSGLVCYAGEAINLAADSREAFLRAIESGSGLHYSLTFDSSTENTKDTAFESWIGTDYRSWNTVIAEQYSEMSKVYEWLESSRPVSYEMDKSGVAVVGFESGNTLLINYETEAIKYKEITLEPYGYAVMKGGNLVGQSK